MQENNMYIIYTPSSTEHDFEEMWNKQSPCINQTLSSL
jgi:hypothetical protein